MSIISQIEEASVIEKSIRALEKAKRIEKKNIAKGYRYIHVNSRTKVLVECNEKGEPTERGKRQLAGYGGMV